jgi:hypothetical protein
MKMVKSLLLGSAAGIVAVAGAQAADLPVKAKPVQYVKICTLYGDGFYYIPGSDTCIKFQGYIRADYSFNGRSPHVSGATGAQDRTVARYATRHRGNFAIDTRTQTAYGTLRTFMNLNVENSVGEDDAAVSRAFIQWGGFTFGRTASFTDHEGSLGDSGFRSLYTGLVDATTGAAGINQIAYTWQLGNGITLNIGGDEAVTGRPYPQTADPLIGTAIRPTLLTACRIPIRGWRCGSAKPGAAPALPLSATRMRPVTMVVTHCPAIRTTSGAGRSKPASRSSLIR